MGSFAAGRPPARGKERWKMSSSSSFSTSSGSPCSHSTRLRPPSPSIPCPHHPNKLPLPSWRPSRSVEPLLHTRNASSRAQPPRLHPPDELHDVILQSRASLLSPPPSPPPPSLFNARSRGWPFDHETQRRGLRESTHYDTLLVLILFSLFL
ncbi:hypothetical protein VTJ49DRAFT_5711 [Mycothermus thermophilus]|uniref:Uncharacterized protein n=1 Tax=Humicola insolens TaxID=85995 RepID=A0ABR3VKL6_HUMIN